MTRGRHTSRPNDKMRTIEHPRSTKIAALLIRFFAKYLSLDPRRSIIFEPAQRLQQAVIRREGRRYYLARYM